MDRTFAILEVMAGINACFIYINRDTLSTVDKKVSSALEKEGSRYMVGNTCIFKTSLSYISLEHTNIMQNELYISSCFDTAMKKALAEIECGCGCTTIENKSILRLPSEGWEELVDMWSCHNREFEHFCKKELLPQKEGILYSTLYLLISRERDPVCIKQSRSGGKSESVQIFYNELKINIPEENLIFHYLYDLFQIQKTVEVVENKEKAYNLSLFGVTNACKTEIDDKILNSAPVLALKILYCVGRPAYTCIKDRDRDRGINKYFSKKIISIVEANATGTKIDKGTISFIFRV